MKLNTNDNMPLRPGGRPKFNIYWVWISLALVILAWGMLGREESVRTTNWDDVAQMVEQGDVEKIVVINKEIAEVYLKSDRIERYAEKKEYEGIPLQGPQLTFNIGSLDHFQNELQELTEESQQKVPLSFEGRRNWFDDAFTMIFPILIFIGIWWFLWRGMSRGGNGGGNGIFNVGKAKAQMFDKDSQVKVTFKDVAGLEEAKVEIMEIVDFLKNPGKYRDLGGKIPKGALLVGPPGTGKTLLAKAVAGEANVPFFSIAGSDFVEWFVGVGASRVRDLFKQAKAAAPAIVFIDEIDAVGRQRGAGLGGGHDEREQTLNQLLTEMDGFEGNATVILIAATNRPDVLDPALLRPGRFDRQITVDRPDVKGREKILQVHSANKPLEPDVEYGALAKLTPGFTGADLANLMNEAALLAARRDKDAIGMEEIEEAMERVIAGPERKSHVVSELERTTIAFHESGHALVGHYLSNADPVHKITIVPRGQALGYTLSLPEEDHFLQTRNAMFEQIAVLLGGRTAEELFCEDITTGASNDLERATKLARQMVTRYGMSKVLGTQVFGEAQHEVFLGRDYADKQDYSPETALRIDGEVSRIMRQAHEKAKAILEEHTDQIRTMAGVLLERETVEGEAVQALLDDTWDEYLQAHPEEKANEEAAEVGHVVAPAGDATGDGGLDELGSEEAHEPEEELDHELDPKDPKSPEDPED